MTLKRIWHLLQPEERRKVWKMAGTVFLSALLDFVSLATLLPVLYILLEGGENRRAALLFCLLAILVIVVKSVLATVFTRYQDRCLLSFYRRLSFSLFSAYYRRGLLFIRGSPRISAADRYLSGCVAAAGWHTRPTLYATPSATLCSPPSAAWRATCCSSCW